MTGWEILGGVALTVFGIRFLRKGLDRLFGGQLISWLSRMTEKPLKSFGAGILTGAIAPSSTALSLVAVQMLNTGQLNAERMLALLLGANVGITVTIQLVAFHITDWAGVFLVTGVVAFQFMHREVFRGIGQCLLALGFIFISMRMIGTGAQHISAVPEVVQGLHLLQGHPVIVFLAAVVVAVALQSSTAVIGLGIGLASGGLFTVPLIIPWILGTNTGIGVTSLVAGWNNLEGKRLGAANLLLKVAVAAPLLWLPDLSAWLFREISGSQLRQIAWFHTGFNLAVGLLALPLLPAITRLVRMLIVAPASPQAPLQRRETFLNEQALDSPSMALAHATRETLQMGDEVKHMLEHFWSAYTRRDQDMARQVQQLDDRIDTFNRSIKDYLSRVSEGMSEQEVQWQFTLLTFSNELESVGDLIDKNLCDALFKQVAENVEMPPMEEETLAKLHRMVADRIDVALSLMTTRDSSQAKTFLAGKESLNEWCRERQKEHYARLKAYDADSLNSSAFFLDVLNSFRRINSHITTLAYSFQRKGPVRREKTA